MAIADRYIGRAWYGVFIYSGGTVTMSGDQTEFGWEETAAMIEASAGSETREAFLVGLLTGKANLNRFDTATAGSALATALSAGVSGTVRFGPNGTVAGKPKYEIAAIVDSSKVTYPYADKVMIEAGFSFSGDWVKNYARSGDTW